MLKPKLKDAGLLAALSHVVVLVVLFFAGVLIAWQLFTANYPTHSDVFWMGVECGMLVVVFLVCLFLGLFFLCHLVKLLRKLKG